MAAEPFVKWAGGKRKLLPHIHNLAPKFFQRYLEPFLGGGAFALALDFHPMLLNDANQELITAFEVVRDNVNDLMIALDAHKSAHSEKYFYEVREQKLNDLTKIQRAARFIYLNKTAFNGLYRVNKHGQFNVPFGRYRNPTIYNRENLLKASQTLQDSELYSLGYTEFLDRHAAPRDFIYLDPPYHPVGKYSDFKRYTKEQFREEDQIKLGEIFGKLIEIGAYPVLSNSYSELTLQLYKEYNIVVVEAPRNINHDGTGRGPIREILVTPKDTYGIWNTR